MIHRTTTAAFILLAAPAAADVTVRFVEGAPKDRFEVTNTGTCAIGAAELVIDLGGPAAGLVFDVTDAGAGVEVFQPFEIVSGGDALERLPTVRDGDTAVVLALSRLPAAQSLSFTIDVDDTAGGREITVSDSEISGAQVYLRLDGMVRSGAFAGDAQATLPAPPCNS